MNSGIEMWNILNSMLSMCNITIIQLLKRNYPQLLTQKNIHTFPSFYSYASYQFIYLEREREFQLYYTLSKKGPLF